LYASFVDQRSFDQESSGQTTHQHRARVSLTVVSSCDQHVVRLFFHSYNYNSQAVPEPDEFNAVDFDPAKFVEQQTQCKQRQSLIVENNGTMKYTQTTTTTTTALPNKPKRFRSENNLIPNDDVPTTPSFPYVAPASFPLWPFQLYPPSYLPFMLNAIRLSSMSNNPAVAHIDEKHSTPKNNRKSFEIDGILNLSLRDKKRKQLSDTLSSDEDESI
jgi:hypothetical protein